MSVRTPFGSGSTAEAVAVGIDLSGKRAVITGGTVGAGAETVRVLAAHGAEVTITARTLAAAEHAATGVRDRTGNRSVRAAELDLSDRRSVGRFLNGWQGRLDILVNAATVAVPTDLRSDADGWELHFGGSVLGVFELTVGLFDHLAATDGGARVVFAGSGAHQYSPVVFDDINFRWRPYDPRLAHGQSATAAVLLAVAASAQWASAGVLANAMDTGPTAARLLRRAGPTLPGTDAHRTAAQRAATIVLLAVSPFVDGIGGRYFDDCNEAPTVDRRTPDLRGVARYALDLDNAERLWSLASQWLRG